MQKNDPSRTSLILEFNRLSPIYTQLGLEIVFSLKHLFEKRGIKVASISSRAKDLSSFLSKIERKTYADPFSEITDLAGVRVVCLYKSDLDLICELIEKEFIIVEKLSTVDRLEKNELGYDAIHFIVKLGNEFSGARYENLKGMLSEIQVRTVLQDAWSHLDHDLIYKNEDDIPEEFRREFLQL